jgi:hypothetical protein
LSVLLFVYCSSPGYSMSWCAGKSGNKKNKLILEYEESMHRHTAHGCDTEQLHQG